MDRKLIYPSELKMRLKKRAVRILNDCLVCHNHNVKFAYLAFLQDLTREFHKTITVVVDTYTASLRSIGHALIEMKDTYFISRLSDIVLEMFTHFIKAFDRMLQTTQIYLLQLEKILVIHGWHLVCASNLVKDKSWPPRNARIVLDHIKRLTTDTSTSPCVDYSVRVRKHVFDPIFFTIVHHLKDVSWLEDYLFCNKNSPDDQLKSLEKVVREDQLNIYWRDEKWYRRIPTV